MCEKKSKKLVYVWKAKNLKITNVALVAMSQGFPRVTEGYQGLPKVSKSSVNLIKLYYSIQLLIMHLFNDFVFDKLKKIHASIEAFKIIHFSWLVYLQLSKWQQFHDNVLEHFDRDW